MDSRTEKIQLSEINNSIGRFKNKYDSAEEIVGELGGKLINKSKTKQQERKKMKAIQLF